MFEQAAEQQAADFLHRVFRGEGDGRNKMVLLTATLYLAQEVLKCHKRKRKVKSFSFTPTVRLFASVHTQRCNTCTFTVWS